MAGRSILTPQSAAQRGIALPPVATPRSKPDVLRASREPFTSYGANGTAVMQTCDAQRMVLAGGDLWSLTLHPDVIPFERLYRRLPEEGMFDPTVSPQSPFAFELGAFQVPENFVLGVYDLRPDVYRLSGLDPGDFVPVEERRFASIMGFEVTVDKHHHGNIVFEVDPIAIQATGDQAFIPALPPSAGSSQTFQFGTFDYAVPATTPAQPQQAFNIAAANSFASAAGAGTGLMPQRPTRYGALSIPFTLFAKAGQVVQARCVIFRPIPTPIAFIEFDLAGALMPQKWLDAVLKCIEPTREALVGPGGRRVTGEPR